MGKAFMNVVQGEVERLLRAGKAELSPELRQLQACLHALPASGVASLRAPQSLPSGGSSHRYMSMGLLDGSGSLRYSWAVCWKRARLTHA